MRRTEQPDTESETISLFHTRFGHESGNQDQATVIPNLESGKVYERMIRTQQS